MRLAIRVGNLPPYIALSLAGHLSVVLAMALLAGLNSSGKALEPSIRVDLVGASALDECPDACRGGSTTRAGRGHPAADASGSRPGT